MPSSQSALVALRKLEADRQTLAQRQRELEAKAAAELGVIFLGSGVEAFSRASLKRIAMALGKLGETASLQRLVAARPDE